VNVALRPPSTCISVCSGVGGLDLGLYAACGVEPVVYLEREAHAAAVLVARMEEAVLCPAPVWSDLTTFDARPLVGLVDLVAGGTPCQDLSLAGKRRGLHGERSRLFFEHVRLATECAAPFFFWENVAGAIGVVPAVAEHLHAAGYERIVWTDVRASDVGAPHRRARIFLLAYSPRLGEREPHNHQRAEPRERPRQDAGRRGVRRHKGVADAERQGLEGQRRWGGLGEGGRPLEVGGGGRRVFPPARDDLAAWRQLLAARPDLAPAISGLRRLDDGVGARLDVCLCPREDRLRAAGNGVVPQQAALAWRLLWAALLERLTRGCQPA
jgi:DNA (cytosine-5)-methyltransferase 1